jgi:hypothetical protein
MAAPIASSTSQFQPLDGWRVIVTSCNAKGGTETWPLAVLGMVTVVIDDPYTVELKGGRNITVYSTEVQPRVVDETEDGHPITMRDYVYDRSPIEWRMEVIPEERQRAGEPMREEPI